MKWKKEPILKADDIYVGCLTCSTAAIIAPLDMVIAVGFGNASASKDGECVYCECDCTTEEELKTVQDIEDMAVLDPDHDWRIVKRGPMHGETFQRQKKGHWYCIESNEGFA